MTVRAKIAILLILFGVIGLAYGKRGLNAGGPDRDKLYRAGEILAEVTTWILDRHVDEVDPDALLHGALRGMAESLDAHSTLLSPRELEMLREESAGSYGGIGVLLMNRGGELTVLSVEKEGPAWREGLRAGDRVLVIDGRNAGRLNADRASALLRGEAGTEVHLKIVGGMGENARALVLVRERIAVKSVGIAALVDPGNGLGYVRVSFFRRDTAKALDSAVRALLEKGCKGLVLDLRNNPGGALETAVRSADLFVRDGVLVTTTGRASDAMETYRASARGTLPPVPLAVLINGGCASAAEILAGALRHNGRATLVGSRTYGKRSIQSIALLEDGWALKLTTARYYFSSKETEGGEGWKTAGLEPDIPIEEKGVEARGDPALEAALKTLRDRLK